MKFLLFRLLKPDFLHALIGLPALETREKRRIYYSALKTFGMTWHKTWNCRFRDAVKMQNWDVKKKSLWLGKNWASFIFVSDKNRSRLLCATLRIDQKYPRTIQLWMGRNTYLISKKMRLYRANKKTSKRSKKVEECERSQTELEKLGPSNLGRSPGQSRNGRRIFRFDNFFILSHERGHTGCGETCAPRREESKIGDFDDWEGVKLKPPRKYTKHT